MRERPASRHGTQDDPNNEGVESDMIEGNESMAVDESNTVYFTITSFCVSVSP